MKKDMKKFYKEITADKDNKDVTVTTFKNTIVVSEPIENIVLPEDYVVKYDDDNKKNGKVFYGDKEICSIEYFNNEEDELDIDSSLVEEDEDYSKELEAIKDVLDEARGNYESILSIIDNTIENSDDEYLNDYLTLLKESIIEGSISIKKVPEEYKNLFDLILEEDSDYKKIKEEAEAFEEKVAFDCEVDGESYTIGDLFKKTETDGFKYENIKSVCEYVDNIINGNQEDDKKEKKESKIKNTVRNVGFGIRNIFRRKNKDIEVENSSEESEIEEDSTEEKNGNEEESNKEENNNKRKHKFLKALYGIGIHIRNFFISIPYDISSFFENFGKRKEIEVKEDLTDNEEKDSNESENVNTSDDSDEEELDESKEKLSDLEYLFVQIKNNLDKIEESGKDDSECVDKLIECEGKFQELFREFASNGTLNEDKYDILKNDLINLLIDVEDLERNSVNKPEVSNTSSSTVEDERTAKINSNSVSNYSTSDEEEISTISNTEPVSTPVSNNNPVVTLSKEDILIIYNSYSFEELTKKVSKLEKKYIELKMRLLNEYDNELSNKLYKVESKLNGYKEMLKVYLEMAEKAYDEEINKNLEEEQIINNNIAKAKEEEYNNYREEYSDFWANVDEEGLSSLQSESDKDISELYALAETNEYIKKHIDMLKTENPNETMDIQVSMMNNHEDSLMTLTVKELRKIALDRNIVIKSKMRKQEIVDAINNSKKHVLR